MNFEQLARWIARNSAKGGIVVGGYKVGESIFNLDDDAIYDTNMGFSEDINRTEEPVIKVQNRPPWMPGMPGVDDD